MSERELVFGTDLFGGSVSVRVIYELERTGHKDNFDVVLKELHLLNELNADAHLVAITALLYVPDIYENLTQDIERVLQQEQEDSASLLHGARLDDIRIL